ncbi:hypothetical protein UT300007_00090 [Clostridium sp. CTA-7]
MIKNANNKKKKRGFTLIELIIVIAIIAILAALAIPKFGEVRKNANEKSDLANAKTIANAVSSLIAEDKLTLPSAADGITLNNERENTTTPTDADKIEEYLQNVPTPKSVSAAANFVVQVKADGGVTVKAGTKEFFPELKDATAKQ